MKLNILDIDKYILQNMLEEVTDSVYFSLGNIPTEKGLFSYELFGDIGSEDRKKRFCYIDLKRPFLNATFYKVFVTLDRKFEGLFSGNKYYSINNGKLVEDMNGETGISFFYKNYEKFIFDYSDSKIRKDKIDLVRKSKKTEIFQTKLLVIPAFYRDFNPNLGNSGKPSKVDECNQYYSNIIRNIQGLKETSGFGSDIIFSSTEAQIQKNLIDLSNYFISQIPTKKGLLHQGLLGKATDYSTRSVITTNRFNYNTWRDNKIRFGYTGIPLSQMITLFYPFFIKNINDFIDEYIKNFTVFTKKDGTEVRINNIKQQFSDEKIKKEILESYIQNVHTRFDTIYIEDPNDGEKFPLKIFNKELKRNFTKIDLLYIIAMQIQKWGHCYITRYPLTGFQSIYPSKIHVMTTVDTIPEIQLGDEILKDYPLVIPDYPIEESNFRDSTVFNPSYCEALGADFDGDTVSIRAVYTQEANIEAENLINSKTMILNNEGESTRHVKIEVIQTLYALTKD